MYCQLDHKHIEKAREIWKNHMYTPVKYHISQKDLVKN